MTFQTFQSEDPATKPVAIEERTPGQQRLDKLDTILSDTGRSLRHVSWAPGAEALTLEERRAALADMLESFVRGEGTPVYFTDNDELLSGEELVQRVRALTDEVSSLRSRLPLSEEQIILATDHISMDMPGCFIYVARATERAHGIINTAEKPK